MKHHLSFVLLFCVVLSGISADAEVRYSGGAGTLQSPYLISTPEDWNAIAGNIEDYSSYFELTDNIEFPAGSTIEPIAGEGTGAVFQDVLDGRGFVLYYPTVDCHGEEFGGLFARVEGGTIKNLTLWDANVLNGECCGGLVGQLKTGLISKCEVWSTVKGKTQTGGVVGQCLENGVIYRAYASGTVESETGYAGRYCRAL